MGKPLISVIVPVYNIERYIGICIESILNQTYKNLEIILVDDGSRDRCPEICDLYASKDGRIKVIHKPNGGLVSARKAGLWQSNGAYINYVDGDDWIDPGFIEGLYTAAETGSADMVCAGWTRDLFSKSEHFTNLIPTGIYEGRRLQGLWKSMISYGPYYRPGITTYVWNKLFRREILLSPQASVDDRISIGEDGAVTYPTLSACNCVVVTDNVAYHYRQREDSMLKRNTGYADEAQKLKYLYDHLVRWTDTMPADLNIKKQVVDYVLSIAIIRSGGKLPQNDYSTFDTACYGKNVVIYSAGTFGQQLVNRFRETAYCNLVGWLDDDYWEYRRCCLDVDPVESILTIDYDYILIATVDSTVAGQIEKRLLGLGVSANKVLAVSVPKEKEQLLERFLNVAALRFKEAKKNREVLPHA